MMLVMALPVLLIVLLSLVSGIVMIVGGLKMLRLESYGWAMTASIVAVLPFNPVGLIGLVVGIWGLVVLNQPNVRAAFGGRAGGPPPTSWAWIGWVVLAVVFLALIALVPLLALLGWVSHH